MALSTPVIPTNGEGSSGTDLASYTTGSIAFANNKLYLLAVCNGLSGTPSTPTVTGGSLTWVQVNTTTRNNCRVTVFRALKTSGASTGTLTIAFGGTTQSSCLWQVTEWAGVPTTGTDGSDAVPQNNAANQAGTNATTTLPNAVTTDGATYGAVFVNSTSDTATAGTGFTELGTTATAGSPSIRRSAEYALPGIRTVNMTIGGSTNNWGIVACEVVVAAVTSQSITQNSGGIPSAETFYSPTVAVAGSQIPIVYRDAQQNAINNGASLAVTKPVGLQVGDFMLGIVAIQADNTITTVPSGFQQYRMDTSAVVSQSGIRVYLHWKIADAADVAATNFRWAANSSADIAIGLLAYSGVSASNPFDAVAVTPDESTTSAVCVAPSVTTTVTGDFLLVASAINPQLAAGTESFATPATFTERVDASPAFVSGSHVRAALSVNEKQILTTPTATGTTSVTPSAAGKNLAYSILLVSASQAVTSAQGPKQYIDMNGTVVEDTTATQSTGTNLTGCMHGFYSAGGNSFDDDEGVIGKKFGCVRVYQVNGKFGTVHSSAAGHIQKNRMVVVSHKPNYRDTSLQNTAWQRIGNGTEDADIIKIARGYKQLGAELIFIFHHEPHDNCRTMKPSAATTSNAHPYGDDYGTAADYLAAWTRIKQIFVQEGAHVSVGGNVRLGYCAVANYWAVKEDKGLAPGGNTLYPGDSIIDVFCHDDYNWYKAEKWSTVNGQLSHTGDYNGSWSKFESDWGPTITMCDAHKKPLVIGEFGSDHGRGETGSNGEALTRDNWFINASTWIQTNTLAKKWMIGFCYFHSPEPTVNWQFTTHDSSNDGLAGWKKGFVRSATGTAQNYFLAVPHTVAPNGLQSGGGGGGGGTTTTNGFGIPSEENFYKATVAFSTGDQTITALAIETEEDFGYHTVAVAGGPQGITFPNGGIRSEETFYRATIYLADVQVAPTPPVRSRENALAAIMGISTQVLRRVEIYEQDGTTPFYVPAPVVGGSVSVDMFRDERRTMDLVLDNTDTRLNDYPGGFWYDKVIKVYRGVEYGGVTYGLPPDTSDDGLLGTFVIDTIESQNFPHTVQVTGRDFTKRLILSKFKYTESFKPNTFIPDIIQGIAFDGGIPTSKQKLYRPFPIPPEFYLAPSSSTATDTDTTFERGSPRWDAIKLLAEACNCAIYFDRFGVLILEPFADPFGQAPEFIFSAQQKWGDPNLVTFKRRVGDSQLFNVVIVTGGKAGDAVSPYAIKVNNAPGSPTSVDEIGERVADPINNPLLTTAAQCEAVASSWLKILANEEFSINFESIVIPWLDVNTVVEFVNPLNSTDPKNFLLTTLTIPLSLEAMSSEARRVVRVEDISVV